MVRWGRWCWGAVLVGFLASCTASASQPSVTTTTGSMPSATSSASEVYGKVDIGGYELAYDCRGAGSPTIIAEAGYNTGGTTTFAGVMDPMSTFSRVCTYDRAGTGNSDPRPKAIAKGLTSEDQAKELHALLVGAKISPPYVLVAHSYGGFVARLFAATYPKETAAMVLVESSHEGEVAPYHRYYGNDPEGDWVDGGDLLDIRTTVSELRSTARDYGSMPLVVIRAQHYQDVLQPSLWRRTQADLATLSTDSVEIEAMGSGHYVMDDDPAVFLAAVKAAVTAARSGDPLPRCADIIAGLPDRCLFG